MHLGVWERIGRSWELFSFIRFPLHGFLSGGSRVLHSIQGQEFAISYGKDELQIFSFFFMIVFDCALLPFFTLC